MSLACRVALNRQLQRITLIESSPFHSLAPAQSSGADRSRSKRNTKGTKGAPAAPSRTRLAKNPAPGSTSTTYSRPHFAPPSPPKPKFVRDDLPHTTISPTHSQTSSVEQENGPKGFRRTRGPTYRKPRASWGEEIEGSNSDWYHGKGNSHGKGQENRSGSRDSTDISSSGKGKNERQGTKTSSSPEAKNYLPKTVATSSRNLPLDADSSSFSLSPSSTSTKVPRFTSPPLLPGLLSRLTDILGPNVRPTAIQSMSIQHLISPPDQDTADVNEQGVQWKEYLLASETGSGKSIAYLLPVLQSLKTSELSQSMAVRSESTRDMNPRALVLAPTHELSRQLAGFAKTLLHVVKMKVVCASKANVVTRSGNTPGSGSKAFAARADEQLAEGEMPKARDVDVLVGTPMKVLEMVRGRGWDRFESKDSPDKEEDEAQTERKARRGRDLKLRSPEAEEQGRARAEPEVGLTNVDWVVVDEADVLFDPDFQETTRLLLSDISAAKGHPVDATVVSSADSAKPITYPFNLLLTTATIPSSLHSYLNTYHPNMTRLASPNLHRLPDSLHTEYVSWTSGNKNADIERKLRKVWADEYYNLGSKSTKLPSSGSGSEGKVIIFCNKSSKVEELGEFLEEKGIPNVALTSSSETRRKGSNHHLDGFLRVRKSEEDVNQSPITDSSVGLKPTNEPSTTSPRVLITTSLLSRGLDFSPSIRHVFIVDEPRNMIDFLHRAGRSGRAGEQGKVVVFGKLEGRGSERGREVKRRVREVGGAGKKIATAFS